MPQDWPGLRMKLSALSPFNSRRMIDTYINARDRTDINNKAEGRDTNGTNGGLLRKPYRRYRES